MNITGRRMIEYMRGERVIFDKLDSPKDINSSKDKE